MTFEEPDFEKFPLLKLAVECGKKGGSYTVCLNAADEEAVYAFLDGKISLGEISNIVEDMVMHHRPVMHPDIDEIFEIDRIVREETRHLIENKYLSRSK